MLEQSSLQNVAKDVIERRTASQGHRVIHYRKLEPVAPRHSSWNTLPLTPNLKHALVKAYPAGPFLHQSIALGNIMAGEHVVVTTRTSSGKSLIYTVPIAASLLDSAKATALLCYPQRALANDQLMKFRDLLPSLLSGATREPLGRTISRYDGATPEDERSLIRKEARVLLTNPDMLHYSILAWHEAHWSRFLSNLRYLILDEAHEYRGTFGTNVALIMRRLLLLCKRYGSQPQLIATSATMSEPAEHLRRLTGLTVTSIGPEHDGSGQGAKHFWMIKPARHSFEFARALVRDLIDANQSVIAFCLFRNAAEQLATDPWSEDPRIAVYKSGLLAQRRAAIEDGLKNGSIRAVYTTNALELGIDIGALDVCVCIGIPNTMMSVWQRAGRVGRGGRDGAVVLIADERPIDAYYCEHPAAFLDRNNEPLAVNMTSRSLAIWHYACALKEGNRNLDLLTPESLPEPLDRIALEHREGLTDQSFYTDDVHRHYNVRAGSDQTYKLMYDDAEIGEINRSQILREAPPNAIYFHDRKRYRVQSVHDSTRHVRLRLEHGRNRTTSFVLVTVRVQQVWRGGDTPNISAHAGRLLVSETLMNLVEKGHDGTVTRQFSGSQGLSANITPTTGVVVTIRNAPLLMARVAYTTSDATKHAWPGVVPLVRGLMPTLLGPCDLGDFGLHSVWNDDEGKLFVFDKAYDGIDLTLPIIDRISDLFKSALDRVNSCDCNETAGCLRCVLDAETKAPTDRVATRDLLKAIVRTLEAEPLTITTLESAPDRLAPVVFSVPCPQCGKKQAIDARFCNNCGQRLEQSA